MKAGVLKLELLKPPLLNLSPGIPIARWIPLFPWLRLLDYPERKERSLCLAECLDFMESLWLDFILYTA